MQALKTNGKGQVNELNISKCGLDEEDIEKMTKLLVGESGIRVFKLA